ncbi:hypothetical protein [Candidatus Endomicrobiellum agilis]|uniref:hypothetical protein n=1 Tax=Candidatus Endomicrobiellum agilis TaxID=3238957 RepID=UPI0035774A1E|nr:hypothetical protein [Endomicrobium sp.]
MKRAIVFMLALMFFAGCSKTPDIVKPSDNKTVPQGKGTGVSPAGTEEKKDEAELDNSKAAKDFFTEDNSAEYGAGLSVETQSRWTAGRIMTSVSAGLGAIGAAILTYQAKDNVCNIKFSKNTRDKITIYTIWGIVALAGVDSAIR